MDVPPGNQGSDAPQLPPPLSGVAPARNDPGRRRADTGQAPQADRAWRLWEQLRDFDRRYAAWVDIALAVVLFVLCSGWTFSDHAGHPDLLVVAALIFPLVFRRRAPEAVFALIATVAFVQWLVSGPALADVSLLVAMYTVAVESDWIFVVIAAAVLEAGVIMATVRWTVTSNDLKTFVFLTGLAMASLLAGVVVRALRSQLDLAGRTRGTARDRARPAGLAGRRGRARPHRPRDARRRLAQHPGHGDAGRCRRRGAGDRSRPRRRRACARCRAPGARPSPTCAACWACCGTSPPPPPGTCRALPAPPTRGALAPQPGLGDLDALVERVRGTGLTVSLERAGRPFEVSGAAGLTVYRIVQEALTNALKHAEDPASVEISPRLRGPRHLRPRARRRAYRGRHARAWSQRERQRPPRRRTPTGRAPAAATGSPAWPSGPPPSAARSAPARSPSGGWEVLATLRDCKAPVAP